MADSIPVSPATEPVKRPALTEPPVIRLTLSDLRAELVSSGRYMETSLQNCSPKEVPCTFQVFRFLKTSFEEAVNALDTMCKDASIELSLFLPMPELNDERITALIDTAEARVYDCIFESQQLDHLPPGNPGEKEFERLLKPKIALNRTFTACMHKLATLHSTLFSATYKLGLLEADRKVAWREARKVKLDALLLDIDKQMIEGQAYVDALIKARAAVLERLTNNETLKFDEEIDPSKPVESGD